MYYHSIRICCQIPVHTEKKTAPRGTQFHKTDLYQQFCIPPSVFLKQLLKLGNVFQPWQYDFFLNQSRYLLIEEVLNI